jgi:multiple sugar transport system ATP-binding protein
MIAGLEDISDGKLIIDGEVVNDRAPKDRDIAMVFQSYALYPHMTVRQNMGFALKLAKVDQAEIDRKVNDVAKILDLEQHLDRKPANLSGGQRQRVAMGRAIVRDPKAYLMDEPLSNLDAKLRVQTRAEVARIQQRTNTTTVYVTHDQTEALTLGDRVAVMRLGVLQQVDSPKALYDHPVNLFVAGFIGSPAMNFMPGHGRGRAPQLPFGEVALPDELRRRLESSGSGSRRSSRHPARGLRGRGDRRRRQGLARHAFETTVSLTESLGSDIFAYFEFEGEAAQSEELQDLAADAGTLDVPGRRRPARGRARRPDLTGPAGSAREAVDGHEQAAHLRSAGRAQPHPGRRRR